MEIESFSDKLSKKIFDYYDKKEQHKFRPHLGCSEIGHNCDRFLWLSFRWAIKKEFDGRMKKLLRRGHFEEHIVIEDLKAIGCKIDSTQKYIFLSKHVSGSIDAVIESGVPTAEKSKHILEIKTCASKYFNGLVKDGVQKAMPKHYTQMQLYMLGSKIDRALYVSVCKDDDRIHSERIKLDKEYATKQAERAKRIVESERLPEPLAGASKTWYECKMCAGYDFCHGSKKTKEINCRTCAHIDIDKMQCTIYKCDLEIDNQRCGCDSHVVHPDLVPYKLLTDKSTETDACYLIDGKEVMNGKNGKPSAYILACEATQKVCNEFDGTVELDVFDIGGVFND